MICFEQPYWITVYSGATPLLKSRLKEAGCIVYQGDQSYHNRVYALFQDDTLMNQINERHYRSVRMILGSYTGQLRWMSDDHHTKILP